MNQGPDITRGLYGLALIFVAIGVLSGIAVSKGCDYVREHVDISIEWK